MFKKTDKYRKKIGGRFTKKYKSKNDMKKTYYYNKFDLSNEDKKRWFFKKDKYDTFYRRKY
jgi:hypothetical protein